MRSTPEFYDLLYGRLKSYATVGGGTTPDAALAGRMYATAPPQRVSYPYLLMSLEPTGDSEYDGLEQRAVLELQLFHYPRAKQRELEALADLIEAALWHWTSLSSTKLGKFRVLRLISRSVLPPWPAPADYEVVQIRMRVEIELGPEWLSEIAAL